MDGLVDCGHDLVQREYFELSHERVLENRRLRGCVPKPQSTEVSGEKWANGEARGQTGHSAGPEVAEKPRHQSGPNDLGRANGGAMFAWALAEGVGFEPTIRFPVYTLSKRAP
jgi:hypothetical protein